jgi:clan AA aspartic protease
MGITFAKVKVSNPRRPRTRAREIEFLVDTGAIYSVLPASALRRLGIERLEREEFTLADGTKQRYDVGEAFFELGSKGGTSKVIFAPERVTPLLGALSLESLGLMVNPVTREISPMRLMLARQSGKPGRRRRRRRGGRADQTSLS